MTMSLEVARSQLYTPAVDAQLNAVYENMLYMTGRDEQGRWRALGPEMASYIGHVAMDLKAHGNRDLEETIREDLVLNPGRMPVATTSAIPRHINNYHLRTGGISEERAKSERGRDWAASLNEEEERENFRRNSRLGVRTQLGDRGWVVQTIGHASGVESPLNILTLGGGQAHDAEKLLRVSKGKYPFRHTDLFQPMPGNHFVQDDGMIWESRKINRLNRRMPLPIANIVSVDLLDPLKGVDTEEARLRREWDVSNYYTHEFWQDAGRINEYWYWESNPSDNIYHLQQDARKLNTDSVLEIAPEGYDMVVLSFSGYQLREDGLAAVMEYVPEIIRRNGDLEFVNERKPWGVGTFIYDYSEEHPHWYQVIRAETGRMARAAILPSIGRLPLANDLGLASPRHAQMSAAA
jgi:hypothetical protein